MIVSPDADCVILSLWPAHLKKLYVRYLPSWVTVVFFSAGCQNIIMVCHKLLQNTRKHLFGGVTLSDSCMCHLSLQSVWFYLHVVYQIWQKHTAAGSCCVFPVPQLININLVPSMFMSWIVFHLSKAKKKKQKRSGGCRGWGRYFHLKSWSCDFLVVCLFVLFLCVSLQLLFTHHSLQSWSQTWSSDKSRLVRDNRWAQMNSVR